MNQTIRTRKISRFTYFFWWCSGAVIEILEELPTEKNKYVGMGAAIFGTWLLATVSGIFSFYSIFDRLPLAIIIGTIYGLIIFNLDRFITSSMKKVGSEIEYLFWYEKWGNFVRAELMPAIPRIIIAIIIGLAISKPLELYIFRTEVQEQLNLEREIKRQEKFQTFDARIKNIGQIENMIAKIQEATNFEKSKVEALRLEYLGEIDGTRGSRTAGISNIANAKRTEYERAKVELANFTRENNNQIRSLRTEIAELKEQIRVEDQAFEEELAKVGFLEELKALATLLNKKGNEAMWWSNFIIVALIILIEISPILVKLIVARGPYDAKLDFVNHAEMIHLDRELKNIRFPKKSTSDSNQ